MKINYEFVTGEKLEVEVDDGIGEIVIELEVTQSQRNRTETRRHSSLDFLQEDRDGYQPKQFIDEKTDIEAFIVNSEEKERLHEAIGDLENKDSFIVKKYYFENKTMMEIGKEMISVRNGL